MKKHYRQGDVMLRHVSSLPDKLKPVVRQRGRLVLANGGSGHAHFMTDPGSELFVAEDGGQWLKIKGETFKGRYPVIEQSKLHVLVRHPEIGPLAFAASDIAVKGKTATVDGIFAVLFHDSNPLEHSPQALPRGSYEQMDQSEFHREEIRRVTD